MANLTEQETYELAIYLLEITDAVIGGANGIANLQAKQLANRTAWLKANKQDKDVILTALAALTTAADKMIYSTGADTFATATLTAFARTLLDDATGAAMFATIGATESIGSSGYVKLPNGLIIQWGSVSSSVVGTYTVTLPISFPNGCLNVTATKKSISVVTADIVGIGSITPSNIEFWLSTNIDTEAEANFYWFAIGN